ncbi:hypothetical protein TthTF24_21310 (plasmid) [Thermus thermophilus]
MEAPLAVKEGEGEVGEVAPLFQGDQVQDHQEAGLGALSPPGPVQGFLGLLAGQADEGAGGPGVAVEEAGEGGGGLGLAVLGSSLAVTGEEKEQQGLQGFPQVGGWHEGQDGPK